MRAEGNKLGATVQSDGSIHAGTASFEVFKRETRARFINRDDWHLPNITIATDWAASQTSMSFAVFSKHHFREATTITVDVKAGFKVDAAGTITPDVASVGVNLKTELKPGGYKYRTNAEFTRRFLMGSTFGPSLDGSSQQWRGLTYRPHDIGSNFRFIGQFYFTDVE